MAAESFIFCSPLIPQKTGFRTKIFINCCIVKIDGTQAHVTKNVLRTTSTFSNKVFEDRTMGIVCYRDENGEVVCEGYDDEGQRRCDSSCPSTCPRKRDEDVDVMERLEQIWVQVGGEGRCIRNYSAEDFLN